MISKSIPTKPYSPQELQSFSVYEFCKAHRISKAMLYKLLKLGLAPKIYKVGSRTLISIEAAANWRSQMEKQCGEGV